MELDTPLKMKAMDESVKVYEAIRTAFRHPAKRIEGEALRIFEELDAWQFLENFPIQDDKHRWFYITMLAMQQYRHLRWQKDHPVKSSQKRSKWEIVHGKMGKS